MAALSLLLLGQPRVEARGAEIVLHRRKVLALLAYLAVTSRPHSRDELAELLYPNRDRDHSFGDLRQSLSYLRNLIGESWIDAGPRAISLRAVKGLVVDVVEFRRLLKRGDRSHLARGARLYRGGFLSGFYLKDCPAFEQWQTGLEDSLRQAVAEALARLVDLDRQLENLDGAVEWARAAVELDHLEESSHRRLMEVLAEAGWRAHALRQYDRLRTVLAEELGETPGEETEKLRKAIFDGAYLTRVVSPRAALRRGGRMTRPRTGQEAAGLLRDGGKAQEAGLNKEALDHYQRALDLLAASGSPPDRQRLQALVELGKVCEVTGRHALAEAKLREAVELARQLGSSRREVAAIMFLLCKAVTTRHRPLEYLPIVEESLRLLEDDGDSPELVFAEFVRCYGAFEQGEYRPACEFAARRGQQFRSLPYSQDLAINSGYLAWANFLDKNDEEAMKWLDWLEREARSHNDTVSLAAVRVRRGRDMLAQRGDLDGAIGELEQASGMYRKVEARYLEGRSYLYTGDVYYRYGRLGPAEECLRRAEFICDELEHHVHMRSESQMLRGQIALARGDDGAATGAFRIALASKPGAPWERLMRLLVASALIAQGRKEEAALALTTLLGESLDFRIPPAYSVTVSLAHVLSMLETCGSSGEEFREACDLVQERRPESRDILSCWFLQPAAPGCYPHTAVTDRFAGDPATGWSWHDPYGDCRCTHGKGCDILAPVGRGLCGSNLSAPRLLRPASGRFALQAVCLPPDNGRLAVGGLALWKSRRDYLRIDVGSLGPGIVAFGGCVDNRDFIIGRGRQSAGAAWLRLERSGATVSALCSTNGDDWSSVGTVSFPPADPVEVGLFVDGMVRPEIYPRSYAAGSEVRFARFDLLKE